MKQLSQLCTSPVWPVITHLHTMWFSQSPAAGIPYSQQLDCCRGSHAHAQVHHRQPSVGQCGMVQVAQECLQQACKQTLTHPVMPICSPILQYSANSSLLPVKQWATAGTVSLCSCRIAVKRSAASRQCKNSGFCSSLARFTYRTSKGCQIPCQLQ